MKINNNVNKGFNKIILQNVNEVLKLFTVNQWYVKCLTADILASS